MNMRANEQTAPLMHHSLTVGEWKKLSLREKYSYLAGFFDAARGRFTDEDARESDFAFVVKDLDQID
ncbi:MAG TPA: hypothetical protein VJ805_11865, partial [Nitrospiraceae bacterium]|nr:hypothetical protein [Nitrospiraceae bacterium]